MVELRLTTSVAHYLSFFFAPLVTNYPMHRVESRDILGRTTEGINMCM